jgi:glutathione S-transferase
MTYHIYAGPASPYSHKVRALFRYRQIPHTWLVPMGGFEGGAALGSDNEVETPLSKANKGVVPVVEYPDGTYKSDSTPIMLEMEVLHEGRSIVPESPCIAFIAHLIEDMADEYLPIPMFYFRWTDDAMWCGRRQMTGWNGALDDETLDEYATSFLTRQQGQLGALKAMQKDSVLEMYHSFLDAMETLLSERFFFFGNRPSLAEFGIYGQLTQYSIDPTVSKILRKRAVRTYQWTHFIDDLSGIELGEWFAVEDCLTENLGQLIASLAPMYLLMANQMLKDSAGADLSKAVNGPLYRAKCYLQLKHELAVLDPTDIALVRPFLESIGCWEPLQFRAGEEARVVALTPQ